ncbi:MAG: hypothetical protein ACI4XL_08620 [Bacillus sp. (in: firmicutes)]
MGYISPVVDYQYVQYSNRLLYQKEQKEKNLQVKRADSGFAASLDAGIAEKSTEHKERKTDSRGSKFLTGSALPVPIHAAFTVITGKGMILDVYV